LRQRTGILPLCAAMPSGMEAGNAHAPIGKTGRIVARDGLHIRPGQVRMGREELGDIRVLSQLLQHQVYGDTRPLDHGLSRQNPWVCDDAFLIEWLIFFHIQVIIAYRGN
jgi:hypothetical protein